MLNWGIIGCGDVVQRLVQNSLQVKNKSKIINVMSQDISLVKKFVKKYNINNFTNNADEIIEDPNINCIYIACPPYKHFEYIKKSSINKKQILCEKPLVINNKELNELIKLCNKNKTTLFTAYYRRFLRRYLTIRKLIKENTIGKIIFFKINCFHSPKSHPTAPLINYNKKNLPWRFIHKFSGGGNIIDMGTHSIDMIDFLLGEIVDIQSYPRNFANLYDVEDTVLINFELKNSILGQGLWSSISNQDEDSFEIFGTKGKIKFSMSSSDEIIIKKDNNIKRLVIPFEKPYHKPMINHVINLFQHNLSTRKFTLSEHAFRTTKIQIKAIKEFYKKK